jgi:uncharacterized membrane protein (DUF2068 family)
MDNGQDFSKRAPTLYGIIIFKLVKGALFLALAIVLWCLSDNNLPEEWSRFLGQDSVQETLHLLKVHPANKFFTHVAEWIAQLTEANMLVAAAGTLFYSLFSLVEGIGLMFRVPWAGWMAIGESGFFIPIEVYELTRPGKASWFLFAVLVTNIFIVWYLVQNRHRLFRHHLHHHAAEAVEKHAS